MKKFYESPDLEKCTFNVQANLMSSEFPTVSDNGYGWVDGETPWLSDENR